MTTRTKWLALGLSVLLLGGLLWGNLPALARSGDRMVAKPPSGVCGLAAGMACGGGGSGSPCAQETIWVNYTDGHIGIDGWVSFAGNSSCQSFQVYSIGFRQSFSSGAPRCPYRVNWAWDQNNYLGSDWLPTTSYQWRTPNYGVGLNGTTQQFVIKSCAVSYGLNLLVLPHA